MVCIKRFNSCTVFRARCVASLPRGRMIPIYIQSGASLFPIAQQQGLLDAHLHSNRVCTCTREIGDASPTLSSMDTHLHRQALKSMQSNMHEFSKILSVISQKYQQLFLHWHEDEKAWRSCWEFILSEVSDPIS